MPRVPKRYRPNKNTFHPTKTDEDVLIVLLAGALRNEDILQQINLSRKEYFGSALGADALYQVLERLRFKGLITSEWANKKKTRFQYHTVTLAGRSLVENASAYRVSLRGGQHTVWSLQESHGNKEVVA